MHERRSTCEENEVHQAHCGGQQQRTSVLKGRREGNLPPYLKMIIRHLAALSVLILLSPCLSHGARGGVEGSVHYRGESVSGVYVEVFDIRDPDGKAVGSTNTGSDGRFDLSLPAGTYRLTAKKRPEGPGSGGMLFGSTGPEGLNVGHEMVKLPVIELTDMGVGEGQAGEIEVYGSVHGAKGPLSGAYVYFYPEGIRRGPGYLARARSGELGRFTAGLTPGGYTVTVRFSTSGNGMGSDGMGTVNVGDLVGEYKPDPVQVKAPDFALGEIKLRPVDPETWEKRQWATVRSGFAIRGQVLGEDRLPVAGAYVFLYDDRRMVGKPVSISAPTEKDGRYNVAIPGSGTYYLGARTRFGGPVQPGELMGAWDEKGPRPVILDEDNTSADCDIVVREVW